MPNREKTPGCKMCEEDTPTRDVNTDELYHVVDPPFCDREIVLCSQSPVYSTSSSSDEIRCPSCGELNRDLCDYDWGSLEVLEISCGHCDADLQLSRRISVHYRAVLEKAPTDA